MSNPAISLKAGEAPASLIDRIVLVPASAQSGGLAIESHSDLAAILFAVSAGVQAKTDHIPVQRQERRLNRDDRGILYLVAGACNQRFLRLSRTALPVGS